MWLLRVDAGGNLSLVERVGNNVPRYAILSHTWGEDKDEVSFTDVVNGTYRSKAGYAKINFCGEQAAKDKLEYFWVDTCCIDKSSSAELQEAINSFFQWYRKADKCYIYLSDVSTSDLTESNQAFRESKWFTRGWTLQELIAPICAEFFTLEGELIGDKDSMAQEIQSITGIPIQALQQGQMWQFSVEERFSWAKNRLTKREEDAAYCLLGLFNIHMPLIYGEGKAKAMDRLRRKIEKSYDDRPSIFPLSKISTKQSRHQWGTFSSPSSSEDPNPVDQSHFPAFLGAYIDVLGQSEISKDFAAALRHALPESSGNKTRTKERVNIDGVSDRERKGIHGSQHNGQDLEVVLKRISSFGRDAADTDERMRSRSRKDSGGRDEMFADITGVLEETKKPNNALLTAPMNDDLDEHITLGRKFVHEIDTLQDAINTLSNIVSPNDTQTQLLLPSTEPRETEPRDEYSGKTYLASGDRPLTWSDKQILDPIKRANFKRAYQLLLKIQHVAKLPSKQTADEWLGVTQLDDQYSVTQFFDKQISERLQGTCEWIFSHPAYRSWTSMDEPNEIARILWIFAPPGYGKTVLSARIIEHLKDKKSFPVAYFFASPHAQSGGDPSFIIRSWISQIAQLDIDILDLVQRHSETGKRASESDIWLLFESIVSENRNYTFILDGLDEYSQVDNTQTRSLHKFLQRLKKSTDRTASRILITSRYEAEIEAELSPSIAQNSGHVILQCKITNKDVRHDISLFSKSVVDERLPKKNDRLRKDLAEQLAEKCEGMFLWIKLQQDQLRGGKNAKQLQIIVKDMPVGLMKTYEQNWNVIQNKSLVDRTRALSILQWTTFAFRPLTVSEITEAVIINPDDDDDGTTFEWDDLPDNIDDEYINSEIIEVCGGLIEVRPGKPGSGPGSRTIHLIHSSVREFLLSILPSSLINIINPRLGSDQTVGQAEQHEYLATACLGYLNHEDAWQRYTEKDESEHRYSFIDYTARNWNSHITAAGKDNPKLLRLVDEFFQPENGNFDQWRKYLKPSVTLPDEDRESQEKAATPLYYAALFDLPASMKRIWAKDETQLNKVGGEYGTPLQATCFKGHQSAFQLLLDWGADPNVEGGRFGVPINAAIAGGQKNMVKTLIDMAVNHTLQDSMGRTPLYTAATNGDSEIVNWLIEAGADQATRNQKGTTPLSSAAGSGHLDVVKLLLEKGADVSVTSNDGWTPLYSAASSGHLEVVKLLLEKGSDASVTSSSGLTPLNSAAINGHLEVVKLLLEKGVDISVTNNNGWTPLNSAAGNGHLEVVKLLLEKGANVSVTSIDGLAPLHSAANSGHLEIVKLLLENGADIATVNKNGRTSLSLAAEKGHLEIIKFMHEKGADIATANNNGWTPFHSAADNGHLEVVKFLLDKGADIAATNNGGWSPLNLAVDKGHLETVKFLLEKGADIISINSSGWTSLNVAASNGHLEIVKFLLEKGADISTANNSGWTVLSLAANGGYLEVVKLLIEKGVNIADGPKGWAPIHLATHRGHTEVVKLLLEKGADATTANSNGWTPLSLATNGGHLEVVKLLLEKDADVTVVNENGWAPINSAADKGHLEIVKLLLEKGADIATPNKTGWTPLNSAADKGHLETVKFLLEKGADIAVESNTGWTPLITAADSGHLEIVRLLLEKGADITAKNNDGWTPLNSAASSGRLEVVKLLLEKGADVTVANNNGWTPLDTTAKGGHLDVVKLLLENGSTVEARSNNACTPLYTAAKEGHLAVVQFLLEKGADITTTNEGWTPLNTAAVNGHPEVVKLLLEKGADYTIVSGNGWVPLNSASDNGHLEVVKLLLEKEADLTVRNKNGSTPLLSAANGGHLEVVKLLLEKGADIAIANNGGWTALTLAANSGHLEVVKLLLEKGADFADDSKNSWIPHQLLPDSGCLEVAKFLLERGSIDVNGFELHYGTFLNYLAYYGHMDMLQSSYEQHNANKNLVDSHNRTPLHLGARGGRIDIFQYLINLGIDPTSKDAKGDDVLCYASSGGSLEVVNAVLDKTSKPLPQSRHWSPLHWACRAGVHEIVELLIEKGFDSECVTVPQLEGQWSPLSVAIFHGQGEMVEKLSDSSKTLLSTGVDAVQRKGEPHGGFWCNACCHDIFGPRFHCRTCLNFDYCFMCKPFLESLHEGHEWEIFESHEQQ